MYNIFGKVSPLSTHEVVSASVNFNSTQPNPSTSQLPKGMSTPSRLFRGSRALFAAARSATPLSNTNIASSSAKKPTTTASKPSSVSKEKKTSTSGIMKPVPISPTLQTVVGAREISRVEAVKKIWEYIKLHNLQNPSDKREIFCDAKLKKLFDGKDKVGFLEIAKLLSPHFVKTG